MERPYELESIQRSIKVVRQQKVPQTQSKDKVSTYY